MPFFHNGPLIHKDNPVGRPGSKTNFMGDHQHRGLLLPDKLLHNLNNLTDQDRVEGGGRLIPEHQLGFQSQGPGDPNPLLFSTAQFGREILGRVPLILPALKPALRGPGFRFLLSINAQSKGDILQDIEPADQVKLLEDKTDPAAKTPIIAQRVDWSLQPRQR